MSKRNNKPGENSERGDQRPFQWTFMLGLTTSIIALICIVITAVYNLHVSQQNKQCPQVAEYLLHNAYVQQEKEILDSKIPDGEKVKKIHELNNLYNKLKYNINSNIDKQQNHTSIIKYIVPADNIGFSVDRQQVGASQSAQPMTEINGLVTASHWVTQPQAYAYDRLVQKIDEVKEHVVLIESLSALLEKEENGKGVSKNGLQMPQAYVYDTLVQKIDEVKSHLVLIESQSALLEKEENGKGVSENGLQMPQAYAHNALDFNRLYQKTTYDIFNKLGAFKPVQSLSILIVCFWVALLSLFLWKCKRQDRIGQNGAFYLIPPIP